VYIPEHNRVQDHGIALAFMRANPFAVLVSSAADGPFATHLPILADEIDGHLHLRAHLPKANPHWQYITPDAESLVVFHGPHAYVSPRLYEARESVPTWNYAAVHVYGKGTIVTDGARLDHLLKELIARFDSKYAEQWPSLSEQYRSRMLRHIVGFELAATRVEAKFKLSQDRMRTDQENVMQSLASSSDSAVVAVAALMKQIGLGEV
jgi:transcriptional regulator